LNLRDLHNKLVDEGYSAVFITDTVLQRLLHLDGNKPAKICDYNSEKYIYYNASTQKYQRCPEYIIFCYKKTGVP